MSPSPRSVVLNAFFPSQEVTAPSKFVGRGRQIEALVDALRTTGSAPLIFGPRGLGKSSLANQLQRIAEGDTELLALLGLEDRCLNEDEWFIVVRVSCGRTTGGMEGLLRLMGSALDHRTRELDGEQGSRTVETVSTTSINTPVFKQQWASKRVPTERLSAPSSGPEAELMARCDEVASRLGRPVLFVVDEVDLLTDTTGLASFVKMNSSSWVKFVLVGIADSHTELLADHESVARHLVPVKVPPMSSTELGAIIAQAEEALVAAGIDLRFRHRARLRIVRLAGGFPWFVHLLGQSAVRQAYDEDRGEVTSQDVVDCIDRLLDERLAQEHADRYRQAVGDSADREIVLRLAANSAGEHVSIPLLRQSAADLGVEAPARTIEQLHHAGFGAPLRVTREGAFSGFTDEIFRVYARICPAIFPNVDKRVNDALEAADPAGRRRRGRHAAL